MSVIEPFLLEQRVLEQRLLNKGTYTGTGADSALSVYELFRQNWQTFYHAAHSMLAQMGGKLQSFVIDRHQMLAVTEKAPDAELIQVRRSQSAKITLRLMAQQGRMDEIIRLAETTDDNEIADIAVYKIYKGIDNWVSILERIANGNSRSAVFALFVLAKKGNSEKALSMFAERLHNGDLARLIEEGTADVLTVLDILGQFDDSQGVAVGHFESLWQCLANQPRRQLQLLAEILGDTEPFGFRYASSRNNVPASVKLKALDLLMTYSPVVKERALYYATRDQDDLVARRATARLTELWRSTEGSVPPGLEPFPLVDPKLLLYVCNLAATFKWRDPANLNAARERCAHLQEELSKVNVEEDQWTHTRIRKQIEEANKELNHILEVRVNCLQPLVNQICSILRLPNAVLRAAADSYSNAASYVVGTGTIKINRSTLLEERPLSDELMSALLHELGHMEQDVLVIKVIADDLGMKFGEHGPQLIPLFERYTSVVGYGPDPMFLMGVLRLRGIQTLNAGQRKRALILCQSALQHKLASEHVKELESRIEHIAQSRAALTLGNYNSQLLSCLRESAGNAKNSFAKNSSGKNSISTLFEQGEVPAVLHQEINSCRADLSIIVDSLLRQTAGFAGGGKKIDTIFFAQKLYASEHGELISPIVERLSFVLRHVLDEEAWRLKRRRSELIRSGYHEAEAYTISDRSEVVIKAIHKGWCQSVSA